MKFETLSVFGLGYIGLPTAATFASRGLKVIGVDVNQGIVNTINRGDVHIIEPDLDIVARSVVQSGNLRATTIPEPADAFIVAVPTPFNDDKQPDLKYIEAASLAIASVLRKGNLIILESTSPVGATEKMAAWLADARPDLTFPQQAGEASDIRVAHCPERVLPGRVLVELVNNDRVIGGMTPRCSHAAIALYKLFVQGECVATDVRTAEMCKLTENSFRDVNIAFANELSIICDKLNINVWELINLANRHPRVSILQPGPGVGGHCIAVDPWFIVSSAPREAQLIGMARQVNDAKPEWVLQKIRAAVQNHLLQNPHKTVSNVTLAIYGLAFKPDIDDMRESPAKQIVEKIIAEQPVTILIVEPNIETLPNELSDAQLVDAASAASADIHVMLVNHKVFYGMRKPAGTLIDTRGLWPKVNG